MVNGSTFIDYGTKRAMVIDDYPGMRSAIRMALASFGMTRIDLAANATEAVMRAKGADYDIIVSDYNLGEGRDGQQLLEEMRQRNLIGLETAFLMVTAESGYERVVAAAEFAPDDYLIKPFNGDILRTRLDAILRKKEAFHLVYRKFALGELEATLASCDAIMKKHPKYAVDAMRFKGEILIAMGDFEAAEALYKQVIAMRAIPWSRLGLAKSLHMQHKESAAEALLVDILDQHPEMVSGYDLLAEVQLAQNKPKDAQETLQRGVLISSKSPRRQRQLGDVAYRNGDLGSAEAAFKATLEKGRHSIALSPNDFANLSRVHLDQGDVKSATDVMVSNRRLLQENEEGRLVSAVMMGRVNARSGREQEARQCMQEAHRLMQGGVRGEPELALDMVQACLTVGMEQEASDLLHEVARNAHDSEALLGKARRIYGEAGKEAAAADILEKATARVTQLSGEGALLLRRGDLGQGVAKLLQAAEEAPHNPRVLLNTVWAVLRLIEQQGDSVHLLKDAKRLLDDVARLAPDHPRLAGLQTTLRRVAFSLSTRRSATP